MTIPLIVLAALSVLGGVMLLGDWIVEWLAPVVGEHEHVEPPIPALAITGLVAPGRRGGRRAGVRARGQARGAP